MRDCSTRLGDGVQAQELADAQHAHASPLDWAESGLEQRAGFLAAEELGVSGRWRIVAWTIVNNHARSAIARIAAGHPAAAGRAALSGSPVYDHALTSGVDAALTIGAAATVIALIITLPAIRVRREDLPDSPLLA
jgi:hypothetical protein